MTHSSSKLDRDWTAYYRAVEGRPPRETLLQALAQFEAETTPDNPRFAVDLGCGDGRDTIELVRRKWRVLAIDGETAAIDRLLDRPDLDKTNLQTSVQKFESLDLPSSVDLINGSFCLPFCPPAAFPSFWETITNSLRFSGRLSGQLFGDRDSWTIYSNMTFLTRAQVEELLQNFEVEFFNEEDHPGKTALGEEKHWHIFHIVARKI